MSIEIRTDDLAPTTAVLYSRGVRLLKSARFTIERFASRDGCVNARAAPFDLVFRGPAADCITRHIYRLGSHEPHITRYLLDHVRLAENDVALDVGANIGWYSVILSRLSSPRAKIFSFEPDPTTYQLLTRNLEVNVAHNVTAVNCALGEEAGYATLHQYKKSNNGRHSLLSTNFSGGTTVRVPVDTLEAFWVRQGLESRQLRFLKIDVEGFEYQVLRGAGDLLRRCACIHLEYSPDAFTAAGIQREAVLDIIFSAGFDAQAFVGQELVPVSYGELATAQAQLDLILTPKYCP
ncbi:MAG: FkbM family methyltransferase [Steroidobacteraceae bacterium]